MLLTFHEFSLDILYFLECLTFPNFQVSGHPFFLFDNKNTWREENYNF